MGIQDLQALIESEGVNVDLFRIGRNHAGGFRLVLDAEGCLDRLYGGYFSDWACGGQWARCVQFLTTLASALAEHRVAFCVCFNGAHPAPPTIPSHWLQQQAVYRQRANSVLKHIATKGTPPPKVWWIPPIGLHSCLRTALRYLNIPIMVSSDDHHQEVVGLCRERGYAGLVGCSGEYLVFQPPRYFSSSLLKLTYRSSLETKEYLVHDLPKMLEVPQDRLCLAAALLGNTILTEQNLYEFYKKLGYVQKKVPFETLLKSVCKYVRELPSSDIEAACVDIFGDVNDHRAAKLKQSVQYYVNGTKDGFLKYKTATARRPKNNKKNNQKQESTQQAVDLDTSKLASDTTEQEQKGLEDYKLATANASLNPDISMEEQTFDSALKSNMQIGQDKPLLGPSGAPRAASSGKQAAKEGKKNTNKTVSIPLDTCPSAPAEVLRTCAERHTRGLMSPQLLSVLTHRHLTLPVLLEDDNHREIPSIHHFYRPIRQNVYAILFNMHHHRFMAQKSKEGEKAPASTVHVSEWIYSKQNPGKSPEIVPGVMLDWPVPTVQRLWFGTAQDDKRRRLRAFLSCMRSDSPLMLNTSCVPQHLLILATVLRYIMTSQVQVLRRQELDAFLATAFSNDLMNPLHLQEMTVSGVSLRGVQLASLVMAGAEAALLANDACGAPVPWLVAAPWLYADGKLLQRKLARAAHCKHLLQLCDNQVETVIKVERMRKAILEGLDVEFAMPPLPMNPNMLSMGYGPGGVLGWGGAGRAGRSAGARLEIAGVVVGQWGGGSYAAPRQHRYASQVSYVGYTPPPRNAYGGRGWARGGSAARRGRRPAPVKGKRAAGGARRKEDAPARAATLTVNGKTVRSEDVKFGLNGNEGGDAGQDSSGDNREGDGEGENGERTGDTSDQSSNLNQQGKPLKVGKNGKKYIPKGKRKNAPPKTDTAQTLDSNGTATDKKKLPTKTLSSPMFNGATVSSGDPAHLGQGDAPIDN